MGVAGLFRKTPREIYEMRYLWRTPLRLDNGGLVTFLGGEPRTPLADAVGTTLKALAIS